MFFFAKIITFAEDLILFDYGRRNEQEKGRSFGVVKWRCQGMNLKT